MKLFATALTVLCLMLILLMIFADRLFDDFDVIRWVMGWALCMTILWGISGKIIVDAICEKTKEAICEVLTIEDISVATINYIVEAIKVGLNEITVQNWIDDFANAQKTKEMRK